MQTRTAGCPMATSSKATSCGSRRSRRCTTPNSTNHLRNAPGSRTFAMRRRAGASWGSSRGMKARTMTPRTMTTTAIARRITRFGPGFIVSPRLPAEVPRPYGPPGGGRRRVGSEFTRRGQQRSARTRGPQASAVSHAGFMLATGASPWKKERISNRAPEGGDS